MSGKSCVSLDGAPEKRLCLSEPGDPSNRTTKTGIYKKSMCKYMHIK